MSGSLLTGVHTCALPIFVLLAIVVAIYCAVKISLVGPVIAIDGIRNPVAVLARSWGLTKGNSFRLALFYLLLVVAIGVVSIIVTIVSGVIFAVIGGEVETMDGKSVVMGKSGSVGDDLGGTRSMKKKTY